MKLQFFSVDALEPDTDQETIDDFCARHRLVSVDKRFVERSEFCYWSVCVTYLEPSSTPSKPTKAVDKRGQVDYREILGAEDFAVYAKLRDLRKAISEAENTPVYAIISNAQMADMVTSGGVVRSLTIPHNHDFSVWHWRMLRVRQTSCQGAVQLHSC